MDLVPLTSGATVDLPYPALQALAWRALKLFIRRRHLRKPGLLTLGEKCSTVTCDTRWHRIDPPRLKECMDLLARGVPRGAAVSAAEFTKPPPQAAGPGEILPLSAAIATERRASLQLLYSHSTFRFAVTWDPARKRLNASSATR